MSVLSHKLLSKDTKTVDKIKPSNCVPYDLGIGNTAYTVKQIAIIAKESVDQTKEASKDFERFLKMGIEKLAYELGDWLNNNYQYLGDKVYQDLRWPSCAAASRHTGIDCKSFTITASSILLNLKVPHWIREIRQPGDAPEDFTHVYVIIKNGDRTLAIDGTTSYREETPYIEEKDTFMSLQHRGLKKPNTPASVSRAARMMSKGTTPGVRTIGAKKLSKWRYKGLSSPVSTSLILDFQKLLALLLSIGANQNTLNEINQTVREMVSQGRFPIVSVKGNVLYLDNLPFAIEVKPKGLKNSYDFSAIGAGAIGGGASTSSGTGGFDIGGFLGDSGFDLGNLFGGGGSSGGSTGSTVGSIAGGAGALALGLPPSVGAGIGGFLGSLFGGGSAFTAEKIEREVALIQSNFAKRLTRINSSLQAGDLSQASLQWSKTLGFADLLVRTYQQKISEGWNATSTSNLQILVDTATLIKNSLNSDVKTDLEKIVKINSTSQTIPMGGDEDIVDFSTSGFWSAYLGNDVDINVPLYKLTPQPVIDPVQQMTGGNTPAQNSANTGVKTAGMTTNEMLITGGIVISAIAGTLYYGKQQAGTTSAVKSKSKTK